jgi:predicted O-methyltransferase YrrM
MIPFDEVAAALDGIPHMTRDQGWSIYQHVRESGAREILELGCAHGVGACYMAAAIDGPGSVTTVDRADFTSFRNPHPADVFQRTGLADRIKLILVDDSSYNWWLKGKVAHESDPAGNCAPSFDFAYIDGAHDFTIDGLAVILVEKLLRPDGWLLLDDLQWTYKVVADEPWFSAQHPGISADEIAEPHMQAVFDLLVRQNPVFTETRVENVDWGWAHKAPGATRRHEVIETALPLTHRIRLGLRKLERRARAVQSR